MLSAVVGASFREIPSNAIELGQLPKTSAMKERVHEQSLAQQKAPSPAGIPREGDTWREKIRVGDSKAPIRLCVFFQQFGAREISFPGIA